MTLLTLLKLTPPSHGVVSQARDASAKGENRIAVILASVACDLHAIYSFQRLLAFRPDSKTGQLLMGALGRRTTLDHPLARRVYGELTGDYPAGHKDLNVAKASWWDEWYGMRELRDKIAHTGIEASKEEAATAIKVPDHFMTHLDAAVEAAIAESQASRTPKA